MIRLFDASLLATGKQMGLPDILRLAQEKRGAAVMGVLNVTPDSFSDGGIYGDAKSSQRRVEELISAGAEILDIGGESTRPGAAPIPAEEQIRRITPALRLAVALGAVVSVDTTDIEVAAAALGEGAEIINDVSCLEDPALAGVVARHPAYLVVMHSRGSLAQRQMGGFSLYPDVAYSDVVEDVAAEWRRAQERALLAGLDSSRLFFDPGLGFAKNARHSWEILTRLGEFSCLGIPIVIGPSRKSFIASLDDSRANERLGATIACSILAVQRGASVVRVHDVQPVVQALAAMRRLDPRFGERDVG